MGRSQRQGLLTSYMPIHYAAGWDLDQASTLDEAMTRAYDLFCDLAPVAATKVTLLPVGTDYTPPNKWVTQLAGRGRPATAGLGSS